MTQHHYKPLWDRLEEIKEGAWCDFVARAIRDGFDNQQIFALLGMGQEPLTSEHKRKLEQQTYFAAFDYVRQRDWLTTKQPSTENGQIQMR